MTELDEQIKRIHNKLQSILKEHSSLEKEKNSLQQELKTARQKLLQQQTHIDELKQQLAVLQLAAGDMNETDKKLFEKRINGYIKEIDRCISMLGE
jgi:predicted  nucleic acid-binding Zn-ribbon protein